MRPPGFEPGYLLAVIGDQKRGRLASADLAVPVLDQTRLRPLQTKPESETVFKMTRFKSSVDDDCWSE